MLSSRRLGKVSWVILPAVALCLLGYLLVSAGVLAGDGSGKRATDSLIADGRAALNAEKYDDAIASARRLLELSTDANVRVRAYRLMISAVRSRDGYDAAIDLAEKEYIAAEKSLPSASEEVKGLRALITDLKQCREKYLSSIVEQKKMMTAYPKTDRAAESALKIAGYRRLLGNKTDGMAAYEEVVKSYPMTRPGWKAAQELALLRGGKSLDLDDLQPALNKLAEESGSEVAVKRAWEMASGAGYPDVLRLEALANELRQNADSRDGKQQETEKQLASSSSTVAVNEITDQLGVTDSEAQNVVASESESRGGDTPVNANGGAAMPTIGGGLSIPGVTLAGSTPRTSSKGTPKGAAKKEPKVLAQTVENKALPATAEVSEAIHVSADDPPLVAGTVRRTYVVTIPSGDGNCCNPVGTFTVDCGAYTVITYDAKCPTSTFVYDWDTCGCSNGLHSCHFVATNCGVTLKDETYTVNVQNVMGLTSTRDWLEAGCGASLTCAFVTCTLPSSCPDEAPSWSTSGPLYISGSVDHPSPRVYRVMVCSTEPSVCEESGTVTVSSGSNSKESSIIKGINQPHIML